MAEPVRIVRIDGRLPSIDDLVDAAAEEGHTFVSRTRSEWRSGRNRFDRTGEAFLVAETEGEVVGMCGLNVDPFMADPAVGRLRHLYVLPGFRRQGTGRALVAASLSIAGDSFTRVRLRTFDPTAAAFYTSVGFEAVAEENATHSIRV